MCQYVVPVVWSGEKGTPLLRPRCQKGKAFPLHSPKQFTPAIKMKWCLVLWNYLWKIQNNEDLFLLMAFPALPGASPLASAPPLPWLLLWTGCGNSRSQYRGQPAGHCYSRPPSGSLFLLWHHAIRDRETKDDKWRLVGGGGKEGTEDSWRGAWRFTRRHPERTVAIRWT